MDGDNLNMLSSFGNWTLHVGSLTLDDVTQSSSYASHPMLGSLTGASMSGWNYGGLIYKFACLAKKKKDIFVFVFFFCVKMLIVHQLIYSYPSSSGFEAFAWITSAPTSYVTVIREIVPSNVRYSSYYVSVNFSVSWNAANAYCISVYDTNLVKINSSAKTSDFLAMSIGSTTLWWIGLSDLAFDNTFKWTDNSLPIYTNWRDGEPSHSGSGGPENCVEIRTSDGKWNDQTCSDEIPFICKS